MNRYIKFDDAVKVMACEMYAEAQSQGYDVDGIEDFMPEAKAWLNDAPSIDIVRCKECRHREKYPCDEIEFYECNHLRLHGTKVGVEDDWFCADGEREGE